MEEQGSVFGQVEEFKGHQLQIYTKQGHLSTALFLLQRCEGVLGFMITSRNSSCFARLFHKSKPASLA